MKNTIAIIYIRLDCNIFVHSFCKKFKNYLFICILVFFFYYQNILDVKQFGLEMLIIYFEDFYFPPPFILSGALSRFFLTLSLELEDFSNFPLTCLSGSLTTSLMFFFQFLGLAVDLKTL